MLSQSSLNTVQQTGTLMSSSLRQATESLPAAVSDWSEVDVGAFMDNIGLHEYSQIFVHERVRGVTLADLTMEDVYSLGVHRLGDRKYLFKALEHVLAEDEAHHSNYVQMVPNSNTRTRYVPRNSKAPPPSGRAVATSFDALARQRRSVEHQFSSTADSLLVEEDKELLEPVQVVIKKKAAKKPVANPRILPHNVAPVDFVEYKAVFNPQEIPRNNKRRMSGPPAIETARVSTTPQHAIASSFVEHTTAAAMSSQSPSTATVKKRKKAAPDGRRRDLTISPEVTPYRYDPAPPPLVDDEVNSLSDDENHVDEANTPKPPSQTPHHHQAHGILNTKGKPPPKTVKFEQFVENHDEIPKEAISK